jgi:CheY-like chemotaxis protein
VFSVKVLVVEDDPLLREVIADAVRIVAGEEVEIFQASSAEEALKMLERLKMFAPDLVISDIQMPGMSGIKLAEILVKKWGVKVVLITGLPERYRAISPVPVLGKPLSLSELAEVIREQE